MRCRAEGVGRRARILESIRLWLCARDDFARVAQEVGCFLGVVVGIFGWFWENVNVRSSVGEYGQEGLRYGWREKRDPGAIDEEGFRRVVVVVAWVDWRDAGGYVVRRII